MSLPMVLFLTGLIEVGAIVLVFWAVIEFIRWLRRN